MKLKYYFKNWEDLETTEDKVRKIEFDALMNHFVWPVLFVLLFVGAGLLGYYLSK